ncbi:MAG: flagellar basal body P-ring formation chaperone FlgA [Nitrospinales bacterium]
MRKTERVFKIVLTVFGVCCLTTAFALAAPGTGSRETQTLTSGEIVRQGTEFLRGIMAQDDEDIKMTVEYRGKDMVLPAGILHLEFHLDGGVRRAGRIPLMAKIKVDGVLKRGVWLTAFVKAYSDVVKTRHPLRGGQIVTADDVVLERQLMNSTNARAATTLDEVVGFKALRNLGAGVVLTPDVLRQVPLVKRGDRVRLIVEKGIMKITALGVVKENGFRGNFVKVENIRSKKVVYGRVVDSHTVQVEF